MPQLDGKQVKVGTPTDGMYGGTNVPNINTSDNVPDAIDKLIGIIDLLAPAKSPALSTKYIGIPTFTARHSANNPGQTVGTSYTLVYDATAGANPPVGYVSDSLSSIVTASFSDGNTGTLTAYVDGASVGNRVLTSANDAGTYTNLTITSDFDPYNAPPNQGFWKSLKATMTNASAFALDGSTHSYSMTHTTTGSTLRQFIVDNPSTVASMSTTMDGVVPVNAFHVSSANYVSGVPGLAIGDKVVASYSVSGAVTRFYNSSQISTVTGTNIGAAVSDLNGSGVPVTGASIPNAYGTYYVPGLTLSVASGKYTTNASVTVTTYNSANTANETTSAQTMLGGNTIYIDTVSNESIRVRSGQGLYPTLGSNNSDFGDAYTASSVSTYNITSHPMVYEELMLQNGIFKFPTGNYTTNYPTAGPDYTGATAGSSGYRWVTFNTGSISSASSFIITINSPTNIAADGPGLLVTSNFAMYVKVGSSTGWLDANTAYSSGNPNANGDACYDEGGSAGSATVRRITLGTQVLSGNVYVRIGLPLASNKTFASVTRS